MDLLESVHALLELNVVRWKLSLGSILFSCSLVDHEA